MSNRFILDTNRLKISVPGVDILTATTDMADYTFNSDYAALNPYLEGVFAVQGGAGRWFMFPAPQLRAPLFSGLINIGGADWYELSLPDAFSSSSYYVRVTCYWDRLYFDPQYSSAITRSVRYTLWSFG